MFFITLATLRGPVTAEFLDIFENSIKNPPKEMKIYDVFWILGQCDFVIIYEAPSEVEAMKLSMPWMDYCETQTMVAIPHEKAKDFLQ